MEMWLNYAYKMHAYNVINEAAICPEMIILYVFLCDILITKIKLRKSKLK